MRSRVALVAIETGVLAFESVSRLFVIKSLDVPLDEREVFAVMFGVTAGALLARTHRNVVGGVQASMGGDARADFGMALHAFQGGLSAELVATGAIGRSVERLVGPRQRARGNLCGSTGG